MFPVQDTKRRRLTYPVAVGDVLSCKLLSAENVPCVVDNVDEASCRMLVRRLDPPVTEQEKSKNDLMNFYIRPKDAVPVHEAPAGKIKFDTPQKVDAMTQLWCQKRWESGEDIQVSTFSSCWSALRNADDKTNAEAGDEEDVVFVVQRGPGDEMFGVGRVLKYGVHFSSLNDWKGYFVEVEDAWGVVRDCGLEAIVQGWGMLEPEMREKTKGLAGKMVKAMSAKRGTGAVFGKVVGFVVPARKENVEVVVEQVFPPPREGLHRLKKDADRLWLPTDVAKKYNAGAVYPLYRALLHEVEECAAMPTAKFEKGDVVGYEEVLYTQGKIEQTACFDQEKGGVKVWYFVRDLRGGSEEWVAEDMLQAEDKAGRAMPGGFACFSPLS